MAANLLPALGGVALFLAAGFALTELFPALRRLSLPHRLAYAYLLGVATVAGGLYTLSHLLDIPLRRPAIFGLALAVAAAGLLIRLLRAGGRRPPGVRSSGAGDWQRGRVGGGSAHEGAEQGDRTPGGRRAGLRRLLPLVFPAVTLAVTLGVLADAVSEPVRDWDGRMTWSAQARYLRADGTVNASALQRARWYISHPEYPLLLPVAQVAALEATGAGDDDPTFRALYAAFLPALLLLIHDAARRWAGRAAADLAGLAAAAVPFFAYGGEGGAVSAYSDLPLACFYGGGLILLLRSRLRPFDGIAAGLLLAAAVLTKNEGTPLTLLALMAAGLVIVRAWLAARRRGAVPLSRTAHRRAARLIATALVAALALALLIDWRTGIPNREDENYAEFVDLSDFWPGVVTRIPSVGSVMLRQMTAWEHWGVFWWALPLVLLAGWKGWTGRRRAVSLPLLLALAGPLAVAWGAYSVHWYPEDLARVTWNRLLLQGAVPLFVLLALALRRLLPQKALLSKPPQNLPAGLL
ncbi:MAG TPA: hypothetical protein VEL74_23765 [Thermoanaerobaculia bacterium]|nr:hypothetical protein [Thermoanaerobaculia bacterium]